MGHLGLGQIVVLPQSTNLFLQSAHGFTSDQKSILSVAKYRILLLNLVKNFTEKARFSDKNRPEEKVSIDEKACCICSTLSGFADHAQDLKMGTAAA